MPGLDYIIIVPAAYLLGSVPFGFLVAKMRGIDIRKVGSGNIGATNAMRVLGKPAGIFVLLMDALKGYAAVAWLAPVVFRQFHSPTDALESLAVLAGICAVLGHNYTCWLKFKGGKGVATTAGVFLALAPWSVLVALVVFLITVALTRYVSAGSIMAAVALTITVWAMTPHNFLLDLVTTALAILTIYKHKSNIQRLMAGTENRLGNKASNPEGGK